MVNRSRRLLAGQRHGGRQSGALYRSRHRDSLMIQDPISNDRRITAEVTALIV